MLYLPFLRFHAAQSQRQGQGFRSFSHMREVRESAPILCSVVYVQDFNGLRLYCVHDNVRKRRKRQLPCAASEAGSAFVRCGFKRADTQINRSDGWLGKLRVVLLEIGFDALQIVGGGHGPTNAHQGLNIASTRASISSSSINSPRSAAASPFSTAARK